jgi:acyl-CoA dehydrogenase
MAPKVVGEHASYTIMRVMEADLSRHAAAIASRVEAFMAAHVYPNEATFDRELAEGDRWSSPAILEDLKGRARAAGLWNLFATDPRYGPGLGHAGYAPVCEIMGRSPRLGPEAFNCSAPDTGNMELLWRFGSDDQRRRWLEPLLDGEIRSCFAMSEPDVASSDATNIRTTIVRDGNQLVVSGRKWFVSGAAHRRCQMAIVMGRSHPHAPRHEQQSIVIVPMDSRGVTVTRTLTVFGYDAAPHGHAEMTFDEVRVPASSLLGGEGRGFAVAQARLGPGRVHHCMRLIGLAERSLESMCARVKDRAAFGRPLAEQGTIRADIAESRIDIEQARLLTMRAAQVMDAHGVERARREVAMIKVVVPRMALRVIDRAIQAHGAAGVSQDGPLAAAWAHARALRLADGPDEVHREVVAKLELACDR